MPEITQTPHGYTYDNRNASDELRTLRHEVAALRDKVRSLRQTIAMMETTHRLASNYIQLGERAVRR